MDWLVLTALAVFSRALYTIATKVFSSTVKVSSITQSTLLTFSAAVFAFLASPLVGGISFQGISTEWSTALLMVLSLVVGNILYFIGIEKLDAGTTAVAFSSIIIWGTILSTLFLGSQFTLIQIGGVFLIMLAIILNAYRKSHKKLGASVLYIVFSALSFSVFQVTSAQLALVISTGAYLIIAYLGTAALIGIIYAKRVLRELKTIKNLLPSGGATVFAAVTSLGYYVFQYLAYASAPSRGVVVLLITTQVVLSVILGVLLLKEREHAERKLIAAIIAFIGAVLIKS